MNIATLVKISYEIAWAKGWHNHDPGVPTRIALMHSELSEALEVYRSGHDVTLTWYEEDGKPEGVPTELADVVIRIADFCGLYKVDLENAILEKIAYNRSRPYRHGGKKI